MTHMSSSNVNSNRLAWLIQTERQSAAARTQDEVA